MKPKKIDRSTKKWVRLYNDALVDLIKTKGTEKWHYTGWGTVPGQNTSDQYDYHLAYEWIDAMPDRIKEAEEYADRLFSAMR